MKPGGVGTGLMGLLSKTTTHYIRCVKPNDSMAAFGFEQPRVLQQSQISLMTERLSSWQETVTSTLSFLENETPEFSV